MKASIYKNFAKFSDEHFKKEHLEKNALAISSNQSQVVFHLMKLKKIFKEH